VPPNGSPQTSTFLLPALTLVIGGAKSGKSKLAERLCQVSGRPRQYIATAQAFDDEMHAKIAAHQKQRGAGWQTIEEPLRVDQTLCHSTAGAVVLLDCATLWLTNHLLAGSDLEAEQTALLRALATCAAPVVVVSNEVGWSVVPENRLARQFSNAQGQLNQRLAAQADLVVAVMAGLPMTLKGSLAGFA
jgi:adenosylcobinamide kinase / adenosylcobinamide-phosphate guanylyltransferase